ncbi:unnamed protein product [Bursaphelenchus xylophilus]|nr:unnamed protein product [Bursaphelenchus xylophilus]CAG9089649.1 unnamed protein product [Bursaphelenchus xylophilus]
MAVAVADVRAVHDKQSLPGPVALRNPPMECNLLANIRVNRISKLPNRPHTSLGDEVKLFASTISYAYVAEQYELIGQDKQVRTVLGLLSEVPGHSISVTSKGQPKLKRKPLQFVIPNPAKTITIPNGFVTSDIQLKSEVGTPKGGNHPNTARDVARLIFGHSTPGINAAKTPASATECGLPSDHPTATTTGGRQRRHAG